MHGLSATECMVYLHKVVSSITNTARIVTKVASEMPQISLFVLDFAIVSCITEILSSKSVLASRQGKVLGRFLDPTI